ncbi:ferritin-like domain-containing protein [Tahibacter soli]|jgi:uncharacterized ferritin-like protein (DUF455 family)|uniref:Ferritin-like domain-containing protein n=1 Tax=Tahibacter soli TaxID=2983605 RepID=A0A9X3YHP0_9GAMM|nr:ferritin-like domain-containing protein [Tahibacter soli]MDC8011749.1 ferritin-like domain-containing protein [Tahibacter soli]
MPASDDNLFAAAAACLAERDPARKVALTAATARRFRAGELSRSPCGEPEPVGEPGRPAQPVLVAPRDLPQRGLGTPDGRAALLHAVAHIEFNAINLAWDAVYRFRDLPDDYYADWVTVADDEARHYGMLVARLAEFGHAYGDFAAHDGLWEMAKKTAESCLERMALVPRVLEARGLDVTPGMVARLESAGDRASADVLKIILAEEVAHVAAGSRWFEWCCARERVEPAATFDALLRRHYRGALKGPFNRPARLAAGFSADELARLDAMVS